MIFFISNINKYLINYKLNKEICINTFNSEELKWQSQ